MAPFSRESLAHSLPRVDTGGLTGKVEWILDRYSGVIVHCGECGVLSIPAEQHRGGACLDSKFMQQQADGVEIHLKAPIASYSHYSYTAGWRCTSAYHYDTGDKPQIQVMLDYFGNSSK